MKNIHRRDQLSIDVGKKLKELYERRNSKKTKKKAKKKKAKTTRKLQNQTISVIDREKNRYMYLNAVQNRRI